MADKRTEVPSEKELAKLPRWAQVAFAARCARRVQPLFKIEWPDAPAEYCETVEKAIRLAESSAGAAAASPPDADVDAIPMVAGEAHDNADTTAHVDAAEAAANAVEAPEAGAKAAAAARFAEEAAASDYHIGMQWRGHAVRAMRMDLEKLRAAAKKGRWTEETPVPPEFFGPLWPEGEPPGWPSVKTEPDAPMPDMFYEEPSIDLYVDAGHASTETIQEVLAALSDLHAAAGGLGLEFKSEGHFVHAVERIPR